MDRKIPLTSLTKRLPATVKGAIGISLGKPQEVMTEVKKIILLIFGQFEFDQLDMVFQDILKIFGGLYPGYRRCNTLYHDLDHTMDCLLATAQLIHGAFLNGINFEKGDVNLGLIAAFMHDTGYIQAVEDNTGTGGKYTLCHIERSIEFMEKYFQDKGLPWEYTPICSNFLRCTGLDVKIVEIRFQSREHEILGKILGTADLVGQMADENYLGKLPFLYNEFKEGGVPGYKDEFDLLDKTPAFWEVIKKRFNSDLGNVDGYLNDHFRVRWGIDQDLYRVAIERNIEYLKALLRSMHGSFPKNSGDHHQFGMIVT